MPVLLIGSAACNGRPHARPDEWRRSARASPSIGQQHANVAVPAEQSPAHSSRSTRIAITVGELWSTAGLDTDVTSRSADAVYHRDSSCEPRALSALMAPSMSSASDERRPRRNAAMPAGQRKQT